MALSSEPIRSDPMCRGKFRSGIVHMVSRRQSGSSNRVLDGPNLRERKRGERVWSSEGMDRLKYVWMVRIADGYDHVVFAQHPKNSLMCLSEWVGNLFRNWVGSPTHPKSPFSLHNFMGIWWFKFKIFFYSSLNEILFVFYWNRDENKYSICIAVAMNNSKYLDCTSLYPLFKLYSLLIQMIVHQLNYRCNFWTKLKISMCTIIYERRE